MPYPNRDDDGQDRNLSEDELDEQALKIFNELKKGKSRHKVATTLGISQATLKRRLQRAILNPLDLGALKAIEFARLEDLTLRIHQELKGATRTQDVVGLIARATAVSAARRQLLQMDKASPVEPDPDEDPLAALPPALRGALLQAQARARARDEEIRRRRGA